MSSLYEKSVADAKELRAVALKNAENIVLEKHSQEIKGILKTLLEQPEEDPMAAMAAAGGAPGGMPGMPAEAAPLGDAGLLGGGPPPEMAALAGPEAGGEVIADEGPDELEQVPTTPEMDDDQEITIRIELDPDGGIRKEGDSAVIDGEIELEIDLGSLQDIAAEEEEGEKAEMELGDEPEGITPEQPLMGGPGQPEEAEESPPEEEEEEEVVEESYRYNTESMNALEESLRRDEYVKRVNKDNKILINEVRKRDTSLNVLRERVETLLEMNHSYETAVGQLKQQIDALTVSSAKLLYSNRVLQNGSLNERQKQQIVESIKEARNMQEAKTIYETLQNVGRTNEHGTPKSLSEVVEDRSSKRLLIKEQKRVDPLSNRMQRLAGIK